MNHITYRISLDMRQTESNVVVKMKRDDTIKKLAISLTDGGKPYHITEECRAVFAGKKPDGTILLNPCSIEDCVVTYEVTLQTEAVLGEVKSEIRLYGAEGELGSSPSFTVLIVPPIYDAELVIESHDEVNALTDLITGANSTIQKGEEVAQRGEAIFASLQDKEEALDARAEEVFGDLLEAKETLVSDANRIFNGFQDKQEELVAEAEEVFGSMPTTYVGFAPQSHTEEQKAQARDNIGAASKAVEERLANGAVTLVDERGNTATNLFLDRENLSMDTPGGTERVLTSGYLVLTPEQQTRARGNIGAASIEQVVRVDQYQELSESQQYFARKNIGAISADEIPEGGGSVNLDDYVKNTDYATADKAGVVKAGMGVSMVNGAIQVEYARENQITSKNSYRNPITPVNLDIAVKTGITTNKIPLTAEEQQAAKEWLGVTENGGGSGEIPSALPNPHKLTFTGAVNAEYDGSEAVEVNIPAGGGGRAEKQGMELLTTVTVAEDVTVVNISQCDDGTPFADKKLTRIGVFMKIVGNSAVTADVPLTAMAGAGHPMYGRLPIPKMISSSNRIGSIEFRTIGRQIYMDAFSDSLRHCNSNSVVNPSGNFSKPFPTIDIIRFFYDGSGYVIPAGSTFEVWGY